MAFLKIKFGFFIVQCQTPLQNPDNDCVVVDGFATIFTNKGDSPERKNATETSVEIIKEEIAAGDFNYGSLGIVRVTFLSSAV